MKYPDKAKGIWKKFVPKDGQANTIQGELIRAIEKLAWEAQHNGNINWDKDFEYFIHFLSQHLLNADTFEKDSIAQIDKDLKRLSEYKYPVMDDEIYDRLIDRVVEWYDAHPGENKYDGNPDIDR